MHVTYFLFYLWLFYSWLILFFIKGLDKEKSFIPKLHRDMVKEINQIKYLD